MRYRGWPFRLIAVALPVAALLALALALGAPEASAAPARALHAELVRSDPAANAILAAPPSQVRAWFSEAVNPDSSTLTVIDPSNHEVDTRDTHVSPSNPNELTVGLQLLRPGTYVVIWRAQSADDGHVTGGSFIFRVANADGSVPPVPATLPTSRTPGAAGYGATPGAFDGPTAAQALFTWMALLFLAFWAGGLIWETWVAPASAAADPAARDGARLAARRFRRLAPYALGGLLLANVGLAAALTVEVAGSARGLVAPQFWRAVLISGQFGAYWWMRQAVTAASLILLLMTRRADDARLAPAASAAAARRAAPQGAAAAEETIPSWPREALATLRMVRYLPRRLMRGWLALPVSGQVQLALGALLLFAFAMSGHAAATPPSERVYAVSVDLLHLIFNAAWLGGLLYISVVLVPATRALADRERATLLARGIPAFGAVAIVSAAILALTGSLNANVHMTSASQFITTAYGRTLAVKIEIFLVMTVISAYHAFHLRPRLAGALATEDAQRVRSVTTRPATVAASSGGGERPGGGAGESLVAAPDVVAPLSPASRRMAGRMEDWLRREALLGGAVLLCVALLTAFAGTLAPAEASAPTTTAGAYTQTHTVSGYSVKLNATPAAFGSNTFTVSLSDAQGKPVSDASVLLIIENLDMDMGQESYQLQPAGSSQPGAYTGTADLTMAGNWQITVKVLPQGVSEYLTTQFTLVAGS